MYIATQEDLDKLKPVIDELHSKYLTEDGNQMASTFWTVLSPSIIAISFWGDNKATKTRELLPYTYKDVIVLTMTQEQFDLLAKLRDKTIEELN